MFVGDILPSNSPVLHELLSEELTDDVEQLQQTLSLLRKQRTVLQQQIEKSDTHAVMHTWILYNRLTFPSQL